MVPLGREAGYAPLVIRYIFPRKPLQGGVIGIAGIIDGDLFVRGDGPDGDDIYGAGLGVCEVVGIGGVRMIIDGTKPQGHAEDPGFPVPKKAILP